MTERRAAAVTPCTVWVQNDSVCLETWMQGGTSWSICYLSLCRD